ncbi:hypothetical protein O0L34_g13476 [Tuta absoluta]|nr:hypothetical protein O0L34_g13476 [Tuta absoluta]
MNRTIRSGTREVIYKVFLRCLAEFQAGKLLTDLEDVYKRTADMTGKSESTVRRIADEGSKTEGKFSTPAKHRKGRPKKELDDFDKCAIRQKVHFFYSVKKEVPTLNKILALVKEDIGYNCSRAHLHKILKSIGFKYKKCKSNRQTLMEQTNIAFKREKYLKVIMDNRSLPEELQKEIIYLDESYIHSSYKLKKCWQSIDTEGVIHDISKGKRWILINAGSENGFVPNSLLIFSGQNKQEDYHSEMNKTNFTKWVIEKLIPNLTYPSLIVMDNAPYHSVVKNKAPTSSSNVADIKLWLTENNINFDPTLRKPMLLDLVKKNKPEPIFEIDELLDQHGHSVVRLPPYHCDLNPIELIWSLAKRKVAAQNVGARDIKQLTEEAFASITPSDWSACCGHVKKIEREYYERGQTMYSNIDELIIRVGGDSSSESESDSEYEDFSSNLPSTSREDSIQDIEENMSGVEYIDFDLLDEEDTPE